MIKRDEKESISKKRERNDTYFLLLLISLLSLKIKKIQLKLITLICFFSTFMISGFHSLVERKLIEFDIE